MSEDPSSNTTPDAAELQRQIRSLKTQVRFLYFLVILTALGVAGLWTVKIAGFMLSLWPVWLIALGCLVIWYLTSRGDKTSPGDESPDESA